MSRFEIQKTRNLAKEYNWHVQRGNMPRYDKDGYEIFFDKHGFELTVRHPEKHIRVPTIKTLDISRSAPAYVSALMYVIKYPEKFATEEYMDSPVII